MNIFASIIRVDVTSDTSACCNLYKIGIDSSVTQYIRSGDGETDILGNFKLHV